MMILIKNNLKLILGNLPIFSISLLTMLYGIYYGIKIIPYSAVYFPGLNNVLGMEFNFPYHYIPFFSNDYLTSALEKVSHMTTLLGLIGFFQATLLTDINFIFFGVLGFYVAFIDKENDLVGTLSSMIGKLNYLFGKVIVLGLLIILYQAVYTLLSVLTSFVILKDTSMNLSLLGVPFNQTTWLDTLQIYSVNFIILFLFAFIPFTFTFLLENNIVGIFIGFFAYPTLYYEEPLKWNYLYRFQEMLSGVFYKDYSFYIELHFIEQADSWKNLFGYEFILFFGCLFLLIFKMTRISQI